MYTSILILIFIIPDPIFMEPETYNRSVLMEKHPDLDNNFVIFPSGNNGRTKIGYLDRPSRPARLFSFDHKIDDEITFTLYTRQQPDGKQFKKFTDLPKDINTTNKNVFITHGWMSDGKSDSCSVIKNGYLKESDANVFIMDWGPIAGNIFYFFPMGQTKDVGEYYSRFLNFLVDDRRMDPKNFHLIGHSLGAHVSGFAARGLTKGKVGRITGLDPALPGFDEIGSMKEGRLNKNDADLVDVIHTCAGFLGFKQPMGHVDFYPNGGGAPQPGCSVLEITEACSHGRSFQLYAESITLKESFTASKCDSLEIVFKGKCSGTEIPMGYLTPNDAEGLYYMETTGMQPYVKLRSYKPDIGKVMDPVKEYYKSLPPVDYTLADAVETDVIYKLFTHPEQEGEKILTKENVTNANLDRTLPTVLLIHGWTTDDTSPWYRPLRDSLFRLGPHNVIYVNWVLAGNKSYDVSSANAKPIGKYVANFLLASGIPQENIHVIGHSLGSHMSAFIGKYVFELSGKKLGRITALDPAGPKFENPLITPDLRLSEHDALFVDVVHTDIQFYGYTAPIGHVDFYPNEGKHQIGCPRKQNATDEEVNCSHARSTLYFIESLSTQSKAWEAVYEEKDYEVSVKVKEDSRKITFGHHVEKSARGVYYFETNAASPFLKATKRNLLNGTD